MFIAHIPAGYLTAHLYSRLGGGSATRARVMAGMAGGIFPDIDLFYAALVDDWQAHHHRYWTHLPIMWLVASYIILVMLRLRGEAKQRVMVFLLAVWGHLFLDTIAGDVWWLWPWNDTPISLVTIQATHSPWWLNFVMHWTFAVELFLILLACGVATCQAGSSRLECRK